MSLAHIPQTLPLETHLSCLLLSYEAGMTELEGDLPK